MALLCLYYTQQLLPALVALATYRRARGIETRSPALVMVWCPSFTADAVFQRRRAAFVSLLKAFPWARFWMPTPVEIGQHFSEGHTVMAKASWLRNQISDEGISAVFFAHDIGDDAIAQSAMQAFPDAARVCFGDALGVVYTRRYFASLIYPWGSPRQWLMTPRKYALHAYMRLRHRWLAPRFAKRLHPEHSALILPCDPGGDFLRRTRVMEVPGQELQAVLKALADAARQTHPPTDFAPKCQGEALLLLGSYTESKLSDLSGEIDLYRRALQAHVATGARVILKPHPASPRDKVEQVIGALKDAYNLVLLDESQYEIPIEAMPWMFEGRRVISFSYASVSLAYLFNADVVHAMNEELIQQCFYPATWQWMRDSDRLYVEQHKQAMAQRALSGSSFHAS